MDLSTSAAALSSLQGYGYLIIFLLFIVEGPILNYVAAFSASLGVFNFWIILFLAILGNVVGDLIYYIFGRFGKTGFIGRYVKKIYEHEKVSKLKEYLKNNPGRTIAIIKLTPGLPTPGLILAGVIDMPIVYFLFYSILFSIASASLFTILGFYSGVAFNTIYQNFNYGLLLITLTVFIIFGIWMLLKYLSKKAVRKIENI
jgi:membrane protein DedA with SNARE-associated domain